jgi:hypothetical protein
MKQLCFVLMPFGRKIDESGRSIDFNAVYTEMIGPAVRAAGLDVIRADEEHMGGTIHKPMFERLMLCEYAIADLTAVNANVYYELGIRHAVRPRSTVLLFAEGTRLPFDVALLRGLPYGVDAHGRLIDPQSDAKVIETRLRALHDDHSDDSPLFQLVEDMPRFEIAHAKTDVFRERADYSAAFKERLAKARAQGADAVKAVADDPALAHLGDVESGIVIDLYLSFRDVKCFGEMLALYDRMPKPLQRVCMVQEQRGFALNRLGRDDEAERVLKTVIKTFGASSETNGLLGRVYKDRWKRAKQAGHDLLAEGELKHAIDAYLAGFEADWRDAYPGINALTLMEMGEEPDERQAALAPVVLYAASRKAKGPAADYWDHATLLEVAVLARNTKAAKAALLEALHAANVSWWVETTIGNLTLIRDKRAKAGEDVGQLDSILTGLRDHVGRLDAKQAGGVAKA